MRHRRIAIIGMVAAFAGSPAPGQEPELARLKGHVETLASPGFEGRRDAGAAKARAYLIEEFRKLGLEPLFGESYTQDIPGQGAEGVIGVNVGARIVGADPAARDRWIILGAHYDHLGRRGDVIYPGADDNASGVALMLEVARSMARSGEKPRRSMMFVGFDLEERGPKGEFGLRGSRHFAKAPPVPLDRVGLFVTADMIGRSLGGVCGDLVFALGSEREPAVRPWIARGAEGKPLRVGLLGSDILGIDRSDYGPFRARQVPYLFFTTGENPRYHSPEDRAETIDYPKLEAISRVILGVVREAARSEVELAWDPSPEASVVEALTLRDVFRTLIDHRDELKVGPYQLTMMRGAIQAIDGIEGRHAITPAERSRLIRVAQVVLFTVF